MTAFSRPASESRCCQPTGRPYRWHDFVDPSNDSVRELDEWLENLPPFAREHELGELEDLFEAAGRGELEDTGDEMTPIKPIRTDPDIYELRRTALSKKLRFYHGEPLKYPDLLVKLHRHIKVDKIRQDVEIAFAASRYHAGARAAE